MQRLCMLVESLLERSSAEAGRTQDRPVMHDEQCQPLSAPMQVEAALQPELQELLEAKIQTANLARRLLELTPRPGPATGTYAADRNAAQRAAQDKNCNTRSACTPHRGRAERRRSPQLGNAAQQPGGPVANQEPHPSLSPPSSESPYRRAARRIREYIARERASQAGAAPARPKSPQARHAYDRRVRREGVPRRARSASACSAKVRLLPLFAQCTGSMWRFMRS